MLSYGIGKINLNNIVQNFPTKYHLAEQGVDWFIVDVESQNYLKLADAIRILSPDEDKRRKRFKTNKLQSAFAIRRGLLRVLLASQTDTDIVQIHLNANKYGKLFVNQHLINFNSSHSDKYTVFAFSTANELGIDIEKVKTLPDEANTASYIMTDKEYSVYRQLPTVNATDFFYSCWTAKEAYLKLLGVGLNIEPKEVLLKLDDVKPVTAQVASYPLAQLTQLKLEPLTSYIACLATFNK